MIKVYIVIESFEELKQRYNNIEEEVFGVEYNLFNIMKNRKIMCIAGNPNGIPELTIKSKAKQIDVIRAPKRKSHYKQRWPDIKKQIKRDANK